MIDKELREQLAREPVNTHRYGGKRYLTLEGIDQILSLVCQDIEKVENPYEGWARIGFDDAKHKILRRLRGEERHEPRDLQGTGNTASDQAKR